MSLRELNWSGLGNYNIQPTDMSDFQNACFDQIRTFLNQKRSLGVLVGCDVNPNTGLDVKIKSGLLLLSGGKLGFLEVDTVLALTAADATNPRIDRIEADFTTTNERSGTNELGSSVVVTKLHTVTLSVVTGTPAATPSAPARTSGKFLSAQCWFPQVQRW
jgi:hypothetical protein